MRRTHLAGFAVLLALVGAEALLAAPAMLSGVVRNRAGVPQMGAQVELLRDDLTVAARSTTDGKGHFLMNALVPGHYSLKAMCTAYLPTLRENVRVRTATVVNLTMTTLYEAIQWLPAHPRARDAQQDDWMWTLRSAANRPLLRWLEDGPLVVVEDGKGSAPRLKARLMATGQEGTFGESGERISASLEETPADSKELLARVDFSPDTNAGMESMLGFRQDLGYAGSVQSLAAIAVQPEVSGPEGGSLQEWVVKTWETARLGDAIEIEAGSTAAMARLRGAGSTVRMMPFAKVSWTGGNRTLSYRMTSFVPSHPGSDLSEIGAAMPTAVLRGGELTMTHGLHQELAWERRTDASGMSVSVFNDRVENPLLEAATRFAAGEANSVATEALVDQTANLLRVAGPSYSSTGMTASLERLLPAGNRVRLSYANGGSVVIPAPTAPAGLAAVLAATRARRAQTYSISLSGTLEGTGTRWRASYRWQPEDTVTAIAPNAMDATSPYFNLKVRQPIRLSREGLSNFEVLLDVQNLLAEGYQPFLLNDGSLLLFAQQQRAVRGGVAFNF